MHSPTTITTTLNLKLKLKLKLKLSSSSSCRVSTLPGLVSASGCMCVKEEGSNRECKEPKTSGAYLSDYEAGSDDSNSNSSTYLLQVVPA